MAGGPVHSQLSPATRGPNKAKPPPPGMPCTPHFISGGVQTLEQKKNGAVGATKLHPQLPNGAVHARKRG